MYSDESLLHRIKQLNAKGSTEAVRRSLKDSLLADALRFFENSYSRHGANDSPGKNEWETLQKALCDLQTIQHGIENIESIIDICKERATREKEAKDILSSAGFDLWRAYSHLNSEFLWRKLCKIILEAERILEQSKSCGPQPAAGKKQGSLSDVQQDAAKLPTKKCGRKYVLNEMKRLCGRSKNMQGLFNVVDNIIRNDAIDWQDPHLGDWRDSRRLVDWPHPLEPWKDFLLLMLGRERSSSKFNVENDDFGRCEFCWRLAPIRKVSEQGRYVCHLHQRNSAAYREVNTPPAKAGGFG